LITNGLYAEFLHLLLSGEPSGCLRIVSGLLEKGIPVKQLYQDLFEKALYEVGRLWESNQISVAIEHIATSIIERSMSLTYPFLFAADRLGKRAVITCTPGEFHQIGARMVADSLELHGWDGYFLGPKTPFRDLESFIRDHNPDLLAISVSVYAHMNALNGLVAEVSGRFPQLQIIAGGQAFRWGMPESLQQYRQLRVIRSLDELESFIKQRRTDAA
jgi:methanogenic corrinoid protein MtbC1